MTRHNSAGVYVREIDNSQRAAAPSTSIGAIVGASAKGEVGKRTLVTSIGQFRSMFGDPDASDRGLKLRDPNSVSAGVSYLHYSALAFLEQSQRLYVTRVAPGAMYGGMRCYWDGSFNQSEPWTDGLEDPTLYNMQAEDLFVIYGIDPGVWNGELSIQIQPNVSQSYTDNTFYVLVYHTGQGQAVETHLVSLDFKTDGYGAQLNIADKINSTSNYIRVVQNENNPLYVQSPSRRFINSLNVGYDNDAYIGVPLFGGFDGYQPTVGDIMQAWDLYRDPEQVEVNMLINGGYAIPAVQLHMDQICQNRMDCMAILDMPSNSQTVSAAVKYRRETLNLNSSYSAIYSPDYQIMDQYNDISLFVPPSGFIAAAYARTDKEKATWFAPAGMEQGKLNVNGVRHVYNQGDRDALDASQINATRVIAGAGIRIWGAETLQVKASALSNVNVRRLMMFLEKGLSKAALYSVFDPGDKILWMKLTDICERFLGPIKRDRGLYEYGVQCNEDNNLPETVAAGDVILDVYVDPVLPAKRVFLTAIVNKTGAKIIAGKGPSA